VGPKGQYAHVNLPDHHNPKPIKKKPKVDILKIGHFNCQGLVGEGRLIELENTFKNGEIGTLGLSEIRREGEQLLKRHDGNVFYYYGHTKGFRGVGFYINKRSD